MRRKGTRILHVSTQEISVLDIPRVLDELGYDVYNVNLGTQALGFCENDSNKIAAAIAELGIDCVTSYDFLENISHACMKKNVPYIAWVCDTPQKELYTHYALYPCNYIFVFDKMQLRRMKDIGIQNVFFMPLAIHGEKIKKELTMNRSYELCDVAFVGSTYYQQGTEAVVAKAPEFIRSEISECIDECFMQWGEDKGLHGRMSDGCATYFGSLEKQPIEDRYPNITKEFYYEAAVLSRMLAYRERIHILNTLAEKYDVRFYTFDKHIEDLSDKVKVCPGIKYDAGVSCVYRDAKININNTLHCIETGACLRVFEVMAAGGFMLSNYQKELEELFVPNEDIVLYHNEEELLQLVDYYLSHEEERKRIARNGQRKVLAYHTLHIRFQKVMEIVYEKEKERKEDYIASQRKDIIYRTNQVLENQVDINTLYDIYNNPINALSITDESELGIVKEMLLVREQEQLIKVGDIFKNIRSVDEAVTLFLHTKHILWRIENDCTYDVCQAGIEELVECEVSSVFLAYLIKSKLSDRKAVFLKLSEYIWNIKPMQALEIITYALFDFPDDEDLLMYKANYLLELQCFREALDTLKMIRKPNGDITAIMEELEAALGGK